MSNPNFDPNVGKKTRFASDRQPAVQGNKKGHKHLSFHIQELLNDEDFTAWIPDAREGFKEFKGAPMKAILKALAIKASQGDVKAFDALAKYGYGQKIQLTGDNDGPLKINIISYNKDG